MTAPASYEDSINYVEDGENVSALVVNRSTVQLKNNTDWLKDRLDTLAGGGALYLTEQPCSSSVVVGTPVYYHTGNARFEPAQSIAGSKRLCVGVCIEKPGTTTATICTSGRIDLDISSVLDTSIVLAEGTYYVSGGVAGKLTNIRPRPFPVAVLVSDGADSVFVQPVELPGQSVRFVQTANADVYNTGTETTLVATGTGSLTLVGGTLAIGDNLRIKARGILTNATGQNHQFKIKFGSTVILDSTAVAAANPVTDKWWELEADIVVRTIGATGTVVGGGVFRYLSDGGTLFMFSLGGGSPVTVNTTVDQTVNLTVQWSTGGASNGSRCSHLSAEVL